MPENKDQEYDKSQKAGEQPQTGDAQNQQRKKSSQSGASGQQQQASGGQGQPSGGHGQAAGTQRKQDPNNVSGGHGQVADEDISGQQNETDEKERTGGQSKQPGLPEGNDKPWSPASEISDR